MTEEILKLHEIEEKWQKRWEKEKAFEAEAGKGKKFFLTTPYPYISGSLHLGHGRAVIESDIYSRYKRMKGFNVLFPMAFHITGTPVLGIASAIKNGDKDKIKLYEGYVSAYEEKGNVKKIVKSFEKPEKIVEFFIPKMIDEYKKLGLGIDWRRSFTSGDIEHQQLVSWQFEKYSEKKLLTKGKYPVLYSPEDESAMGEDDIQDADSNPVEKQEFTLLKFAFGDKFLVAATLRPETIFGQTNLWINPKINYVEIKVGKETWIVSKEAAEKLEYQKDNVKLSKLSEKVQDSRLSGKSSKGKKIAGKSLASELIGKKVKAPIINRELIILPSNFVDADVGTGIVTSVPSDAPYDYAALKELQNNVKKYFSKLEDVEYVEEIEVIPIIKTKYGDKAAVTLIEKSGVLNSEKLDVLTQEIYKEGFHNGVMLDICGKYAGMKVSEAKEKIKKELISAGHGDVMYETSRKAFSRGGGKIIVAVLDGQWFIDFNSKGWKDKARKCLNETKIVPESYRKQFEDVFDWLDKRPCARKRGLGTKFPLDKNWIVESLSDSTIYMTLYTIQNIIKKYKLKKENLNTEFFDYVFLGENMKEAVKKSKVKENVLRELRESFEYWMPNDQRHTFNLHLSNHLSFMIFAYSALFGQKNWPKKITFHGLVVSDGTKMSKSKGNLITLLDVKQKYGADVFRFYLTQTSNIEGTFDWRESEAQNARATIAKLYFQIEEAIREKKKGRVSELYVSRFNRLKKNASEKIEEMKLREYDSAVVYDMLNLVRNAKIDLNESELKAFYDLIVEDWIKMIAPVVPHTAEELWERLKIVGESAKLSGNVRDNRFVSLESWPKFDESKINDKLEENEGKFEKTVEDVRNILRMLGEKGKEGKKIYLYVMPNEVELFNSERLGKKIGLEIEVYAVNDKSKYDPEAKSSKAKPGKPGIYVE